MKTKQRIINKALELYNMYGIEYVTVRQLAEAVGVEFGNVTRHFPKKEGLVNVIALQFSEKNNLLWKTNEVKKLNPFFDLLKSHFIQQVEYRCLFINFQNLQTHHHEIALRNIKEEGMRKKVIHTCIKEMITNGEINKISSKEIIFLTDSILMLIQFWISEALISHPKESEETKIKHFLNMIASLLLFCATPKGQKEIRRLKY